MTPQEQADFARYSTVLAHTGVLPDIYLDSQTWEVHIVYQAKRCLRNWTLFRMILSEPLQVHLDTEDMLSVEA
jgi:hypothetical protein